jgi:NitT/TauT family transport system substrate-binding protein
MRVRVLHRTVKVLSVVTLLAFVFALAACGSSSSPSSSSAPVSGAGGKLEKATVKVGVLPIAQVAPVYRAIQQGYFKREGLTVQPVPVLAGVTEALVAGQFDFALSGYMVPFLARAQQGIQTTVIADSARLGPKQWTLLVKGDSSIRSAKDLEGKKVGVVQLTVGKFALYPYLREHGVDPSKVKLVEVGYPNSGQALERGNVDAVFLVEPFTTQVESSLHARVLADLGTVKALRGLPDGGWIATTKFVDQNPSTTAAFARGLKRGVEDLVRDPSVAQKVLLSYSKTPPALAQQMVFPNYAVGTDPRLLQRYADLMHTIGLMPKRVDVGSGVFHG